MKEFLTTFIAERTLAELLEWLADINVCYSTLRTLLDGTFDENSRERGMLLVEDGDIEHLGIPIKYMNEPGNVDFKVPSLGEHSRDIAIRLGYSDAEIKELIDENVI